MGVISSTSIMADQLENTRKLVIIGDGAVGKTCVLEVYEKGAYVEVPYRPTVFHNAEKKIPHPTKPGEEAKFHLWDTAGQEAYEEARRVCYDGTHVLLIGFSVVEPDSLANVENLWAKEAKLEALRDAPKLLVGLKADLKNDEEIKEALAKRNLAPVTKAAAEEMATKIGAKGYFETSAKENEGVKEVFEEAARIAFNVDPDKPKKKKFCVLV